MVFSYGICLSYGMSFVARCCTFSQFTFLTSQGWSPHSVTIFKMRQDYCFVQLGHIAIDNMLKGSLHET